MNGRFFVDDCVALTPRLLEQCCRLAGDQMSKQPVLLGALGMRSL
jgi:hypothetical protein